MVRGTKKIGKEDRMMKKLFYFVAVATLFVVSCEKEINLVEQTQNNEPLTFKASIEQLTDQTKGSINASSRRCRKDGGQFLNSYRSGSIRSQRNRCILSLGA